MKNRHVIIAASCIAFIALASFTYRAEEPFIETNSTAVCAAPVGQASEKLTFASYFKGLLSSDKWPARWTCGEWSETEGWLYIGADLMIALAYFMIPVLLFWYLRKQKLGRIKRVFLFFSGFILFCGFTHLIDVILFWEPIYRFSGFVKLLTGLVSMGALFVLGVAIPRALMYRSPEDMQQEIDERKRIQNHFETLLKYSPSAIAMLDKQMKFMLVNEQWKQFVKYDEKITGTYYEESFPKTEGYLQWVEDVSEIFQGNAVPIREDSFMDGNRKVPFERRVEPWRHDNGEIGGIIIFIDDLTEELKFRRLGNKYGQLVTEICQTAKIGVWSSNIERDEIFWNDEVYDIHGLKRGKKLSNEEIAQFYSDEEWERVQRAVSQSIESETPWNLELRITDANGLEKWIHSVGKAVFQGGEAVELQGLTEDITDRKLAHERLKQSSEKLKASNKELESFSYSISHDLRAPLRAINGYSEALVEDYADQLPEDASHYIQRISSNSIKMGALIDDLLEFSRLNRKKVNYQEIDVNHQIDQIIDESFETYKGNIHKEDLPRIYGDKEMIKQVLMNLLGNAIKYSSKNPEQKITITSKEEEDAHVIAFRDNGVGFNMDYYEKLFQVFQRLHNDEEFKGTGIGLSICKRIMDAHDGDIWAESEEGQGSTFYLRFFKNTSYDN
ncbi:sensor histidine kinase [Ekhidna sp.]|uniref:sensor histidine kinase n=1 Tax=Ekhidna sp. TaxID=2608089 RepID=UPI003CCB8D31